LGGEPAQPGDSNKSVVTANRKSTPSVCSGLEVIRQLALDADETAYKRYMDMSWLSHPEEYGHAA
jgi:hypothetical protein